MIRSQYSNLEIMFSEWRWVRKLSRTRWVRLKIPGTRWVKLSGLIETSRQMGNIYTPEHYASRPNVYECEDWRKLK